MVEVLARLRDIELEVLARLQDDGTEHVGSIKLLQYSGKRAMPIFDRDTNTADANRGAEREAETETETETDGEEDERKMEEDALSALARLEIDGKGATKVDSKGIWRTARWEEAASGLSEYADASEMRGERARGPRPLEMSSSK
jgi:LIM domain kinase 1